MSRRSHFLGAALAVLAFSSCMKARRPIVLDSTPPGAVVFVDGENSGHSTPCSLQLPGPTKVLEFRLEGYEPEVRALENRYRQYTVHWNDAASSPGTWTFPLFLTFWDAVLPVKLLGGKTPHRIHVRMAREDEPTASIEPVRTVR